ncbi:patatin-like phospholipase family protein [Nonlabens ponticola]|uniref:Patatin n=1 Tax=Nonlabens ponticola TaxID=2496866 RepID=A0A3S9MW05_9FLAO|nr:patatin-like phospholipase family protein [Nonlabens ponticola]AZQ43406.1 patatin [Nonlabens ponticola]
MSRNSVIGLLLVLAFAKAEYLTAQQTQDKKSPKIGLVLSGGGAKGLAHIGTLKVIDSLGIKVDYIAGTSMGAIIGSIYAAGYTGEQIDSVFKITKFENIISDQIPRGATTLYERRENERYALTLPFEDFQLRLPSSLSKGQNVYNLLSQLLIHVSDVEDFEKLPIPFFCVATDITTGEEVVLDSGYLPRAVNASGALPSLFAPVQIGDRLLTDGGVTDNYPVEKLRAKGMDIIIGVDVQDDLKDRKELESATGILAQINNFRTIDAMKVKAPKTDIYITPDITKFSVISFDDGRKIINEGVIATRKKMDALKQVATPGYRKPKLKVDQADSFYLDHIYVNGNMRYTRAYILGKFKINAPGLVSYEDIRNGVNNLQATNNFTKINYEILEDDGRRELSITVEESTVRNYLRLGLHYDELLRSAALVNLTRKNILFNNDIISADVILGDNLRYNFDYYIDKGNYWSIGLHSEFVQFEKDIPASFAEETTGQEPLGVNRLDVEYSDWTQQVYLQTRLDRGFNVQTGLELKSLDVFTNTLLTNDPDVGRTDIESSLTGSLYGKLLLDTYDNAFFPSSGWEVDGDFHLYVYNDEQRDDYNEYSIAQLKVGHARSFGNLSLRGEAHVGIAIGNPDTSALDFFLGGYGARRINNIIPFYGYDFIALGGNTMIRSLFEIDYEIFSKNHVIFSANFASVDDDLFEQDDWFSKARYSGFALGYGLDTFLGPIELKYSFSPQQDDGEFYVKLGFAF